MWTKRKFERHIQSNLKTKLGKEQGNELFAGYEVARGKVLDVVKHIPAVEPNLSDHGPDHIANVLDNALYLLSEDPKEHGLSGMDLYLLGTVILFHDVGNLYGRKDHHKKIGEVFDWARGTDVRILREKALVLQAARAHTGVASDNSTDTLKEVAEREYLYNEPVQLRAIAAILRFADEIAEGPQRTSEYRRQHGLYQVDSQVFHDYASVTHITADRGTQRIRLAYEIKVDNSQETSAVVRQERLTKLLAFIYERAMKLDQERRYARFYCDALSRVHSHSAASAS